jgi:tetratricopeptide (TPR) repeat protein
VPLESLATSELVVSTIAGALRLREAAGDPVDGLVARLQGSEILLVLDNFEHVVDAAQILSTLLEGAPGLALLVTSRQRLRLRAETEFPVPALDSESVAPQLFAERAAAVNPAFELEQVDGEVVAEICRRLDGVPLAIELAAPRMRLLTPGELLERLSERLALAGPRDAPARQQTLEATIAWSYELLDAAERRVFAHLAVFRGSFTIDAAEAVCADDDGRVVDNLASLLDKSIVYRLSGHIGEGREWTRRALGCGDLTDADRAWALLLDGLFAFFEADFAVAAEELTESLHLHEQTGEVRGAAIALTLASMVTAAVEGEARALADLGRGLAAFGQLGDSWGVAAALSCVCRVHSLFWHFDGTEELFERGLVTAEEAQDDLLVLFALANYAQYWLAVGDAERARGFVARGLDVARESGVRYGAEDLLEAFARLEHAAGAHEHAAELAGAGEALREAMRVPFWGPLLERHEHLLDELRTAVGEQALHAALERGRHLPFSHWLEQAPAVVTNRVANRMRT